MRRFVALILLGWGMAWGEVPNLEGWSLLNAGAVQVRYRRGHEAAARRADRVAEDLYRRIDERFSLAPPGPFVLWIADSETDFVRISGGRIVDWAQGFAFPDRLEAVVLFSGGPGEFEQLDRLVRHEIAHLCLSVLAGGHWEAIPRWFHEGFAMYVSEPWTVTEELRLAVSAVGGRLLPLEELEDGFPTEGRLAQLAYTESFHAVRTLVFDYSFTQLATLLGRLRAGESFPQAFEATYGLTVAMFAHDWKEKAGSGSRWLSVLAGLLALGLALTPVLLCGYWRRRREQASVLARWEEEERKPDSFYR